ncbi:MAG: isopeptide-forming domain-containing fimbrial protein, partial [Anaerococcus sp.]|nr:isopeptide-forming domain-containing fimbrial protein [Anaerococcus sp.]
MKHKILSFLTAFAMVFGIIAAPFVNASAAKEKAGTDVGPTADTETTAKVTIHKIKVTSTDGFPRTQEEHANEKNTAILGIDNTTEYDGGKIGKDKTGTEYQKAITDFFGKGAEELAKVTFTYWVFGGTGTEATDKTAKENYEKMVANPENYDTVAKVKALLGVDGKDVTTTADGVAIENITVPANSHKFVWAVEKTKVIPGDKTKNEDDQTITDAKAVPFGLALPLFKADGSVNEDIHVYPKNTTANQPKVDKDFKDKANAKQDRKEIDGDIVEDAYVGQEVPYEIESIIPAKVKYETAKWTDQMTEGLTFNKDSIKAFIGPKDTQTELDAGDYTVTEDGNGFILELTKTGLEKINNQETETRIYISYNATVNEKAKVQRTERNDVMFHYGNKQEHSNTPKPQNPDNGELKVTKNFPNVNGEFADGEEVT